MAGTHLAAGAALAALGWQGSALTPFSLTFILPASRHIDGFAQRVTLPLTPRLTGKQRTAVMTTPRSGCSPGHCRLHKQLRRRP